MIVAFEGGDGAGKETQAKLLQAELSKTAPTGYVSFPRYETEIGQLIDKWLKETSVDAREKQFALQALFTLDRTLWAAESEGGSLDQGKPVAHYVTERYWMSGFVYGTSTGLSHDMMLNTGYGLPRPDLWIVLDVDPETAAKRRPAHEQEHEYEKRMDFRRRVRTAYVNAASWPQFRPSVVIDGNKEVQAVQLEVISAVMEIAANPSVERPPDPEDVEQVLEWAAAWIEDNGHELNDYEKRCLDSVRQLARRKP